jgi:hypothetical protein
MNSSETNFSVKNETNFSAPQLFCGDQALELYVLPIISLFGIVLNALNIIVFAKMIRSDIVNLFVFAFKCFLAKSIYDLVQFLFQILTPIYYASNDDSHSLFACIWFIYLYNFGETVVEFGSAFFEVCSLIEYFMIINKMNNPIKKLGFKY